MKKVTIEEGFKITKKDDFEIVQKYVFKGRNVTKEQYEWLIKQKYSKGDFVYMKAGLPVQKEIFVEEIKEILTRRPHSDSNKSVEEMLESLINQMIETKRTFGANDYRIVIYNEPNLIDSWYKLTEYSFNKFYNATCWNKKNISISIDVPVIDRSHEDYLDLGYVVYREYDGNQMTELEDVGEEKLLKAASNARKLKYINSDFVYPGIANLKRIDGKLLKDLRSQLKKNKIGVEYSVDVSPSHKNDMSVNVAYRIEYTFNESKNFEKELKQFVKIMSSFFTDDPYIKFIKELFEI